MTRILQLGFLLLVGAAVGCSDSPPAPSNPGGGGGSAGAGGVGGMAGTAGMGGAGGVAGMGGSGGADLGRKELLSEWELFDDIRNQVPADGVLPYEVTSPLFTDYTLKRRFVTLRNGGQLQFDLEKRWQSPVGTIYVKTFAYPANQLDPESDGGEQLVETRLLVHVPAEQDRLGCAGLASCWNAHTYVYNEDMTDAVRTAGGAVVSITYTDDQGAQQEVPAYAVPSNGACFECHGTFPEDARTLGPSTGMFNRGNDYGGVVVENQIDALYEAGLLSEEPPAQEARPTYEDTDAWTACTDALCIHDMVRSYFDSNCGHCHAEDGGDEQTGLWLDYLNMDPQLDNPGGPTENEFFRWGVCKTPTSAGNVQNCPDEAEYDIVPGNPDYSILVCRMDSVRDGEMMPRLGRTLIHDEGLELVREWVRVLPDIFPDIQRCPPILP